MKIILAVSGGVDSMLLLAQVAERAAREGWLDEVVVAQFDHGTRESARADQELVVRKARELGVRCEVGRIGEGLGSEGWGESEGGLREGGLDGGGLSEGGRFLSEAAARAARYEFLEAVARKYAPAEIWTAQHLDDLVETVAINLLRGTGWRGLAVMEREGVRRPWLEGVNGEGANARLLAGGEREQAEQGPPGRAEIWRQAGERELVFREDPTNQEAIYLRNRVRARLAGWPRARKLELWRKWRRQKELRREIDQLVAELLPAQGAEWRRSWFRELEPAVAGELLRAGLLRIGVRATRPQLEDFRRAILEYAPGRKFNLPGGRLVELGRDSFIL